MGTRKLPLPHAGSRKRESIRAASPLTKSSIWSTSHEGVNTSPWSATRFLDFVKLALEAWQRADEPSRSDFGMDWSPAKTGGFTTASYGAPLSPAKASRPCQRTLEMRVLLAGNLCSHFPDDTQTRPAEIERVLTWYGKTDAAAKDNRQILGLGRHPGHPSSRP